MLVVCFGCLRINKYMISSWISKTSQLIQLGFDNKSNRESSLSVNKVARVPVRPGLPCNSKGSVKLPLMFSPLSFNNKGQVPYLNEGLLERPLSRGNSFKSNVIVPPLNVSNMVSGASSSRSSHMHHSFLRSPDVGLLSLSHPKDVPVGGFIPLPSLSSTTVNTHLLSRTYTCNISNCSSFSSIYPVLVSCFCIGATGVLGSADFTSILQSLPPDHYLRSLLIAKQILLNIIEVSSGLADPTPEEVLKRTTAEILVDVVENERVMREEFLQSPEGRSKKAIVLLLGTAVIGLYLAVRASR